MDEMFRKLVDSADDAARKEAALQEALKIAVAALQYCCVDHSLLHPLNNRPEGVAMNALSRMNELAGEYLKKAGNR